MGATAATRTAAVLVALLVVLTACGGDDRGVNGPPAGQDEARSPTTSAPALPDHRIEVRLEGLQGAEGELVAGVLFRRPKATDPVQDKGAVGGFGVKVDDDPFSLVSPVYDGSPIGHVPLLEGPLAEVTPGGYTLMMWRGRSLVPYSTWVPAAEPGLTGCPVRFDVGTGAVTTVTVTGFPEQDEPQSEETLRPCRQ